MHNLTIKNLAISLAAPAAVLFLHVLHSKGFAVDYSRSYPWLDMPFHFYGGLSIFVFLFLMIYRYNVLGDEFLKLYLPAQFFAICSMVSAFVVGWEFLEWVVDFLLNKNLQLSVDDTILDMFLGQLGGSIPAVCVCIARMRRRSKS